jgi:hypothetical protein
VPELGETRRPHNPLVPEPYDANLHLTSVSRTF